MAAGFTQDSVFHFLQSCGGSVKNADLLAHFKSFIRENPNREQNRELFKRFVNSLATVQQVDGVSYVVLRKKFRGNVSGGGEQSSRAAPGKKSEVSAGNGARSPADRPAKPRPGGTTGKQVLPTAGIVLDNNDDDVETSSKLLQQQLTRRSEDSVHPAPAQVARLTSAPAQVPAQVPAQGPPHVPAHFPAQVPAQGPPHFPAQVPAQGPPQVPPHVPAQGPAQVPPHVPAQGPAQGPPHVPAQPHSPNVGQHIWSPGHSSETTPVKRDAENRMQVPVTFRGQPPGSQAFLQDGLSAASQNTSRHRHRQSYKSAVSHDDDDDEDTLVRSIPAGRHAPLGSVTKARSASSPCIIDSPVPSSSSSSSSERKLPEICIQNVKGEKLPNTGLSWRSESDRPTEKWAGPGLEPESIPWQLTRRSLPEEARRYSPDPVVPSTMGQTCLQATGGCLEPRLHNSQRSGLSSSQNSIFTPSPDAGISRGRPWNSSLDELQTRPDKTGGDLGLQETLQHTQRNKLCVTRHSSDHLHADQDSVLPWRLSTGNLHTDRGESESSDGSVSSPYLRKQPAAARRVSGHLRSRMCLSLGADLDQLLQEGGGGGGGGSEAARLNRLNLISSSLSLHRGPSSSSLSSCSTPPRYHSLGDLVEERRGRRSNRPTACARAHGEDESKQSVVPLEAREHAWLVKGAAGAWPDIYSLFREDSSLLNRKDFISGFTVLHWIAKHGEHRVLNTLWYGVQKAGVTFDINARSTSGHTPLHLAAIHSHKNIIRLLVNKFGADVQLRDTAGKKAWQYLECVMPLDIFQLLGAPPRAALKGEGGIGKVDVAREPSRRRRRRHHRLSSASPVHRQLPTSGKVKRSSSLAAFFKHKSLNLYQAQINAPV